MNVLKKNHISLESNTLSILCGRFPRTMKKKEYRLPVQCPNDCGRRDYIIKGTAFRQIPISRQVQPLQGHQRKVPSLRYRTDM